ncbi:hypothetical protein C8D89_1233 [Actinomycetospora cinnamomea]|uniref:4Fe-4S ferredoxin-type domain-containing protein n=1 Tax=Actinomycetospora cinnamomea TaxID=663609 RepID=A0A2U1ECN0_9PSEU|nr:hypothetical protein C8D89_1233 [Actinomycetospora cinnamomea]
MARAKCARCGSLSRRACPHGAVSPRGTVGDVRVLAFPCGLLLATSCATTGATTGAAALWPVDPPSAPEVAATLWEHGAQGPGYGVVPSNGLVTPSNGARGSRSVTSRLARSGPGPWRGRRRRTRQGRFNWRRPGGQRVRRRGLQRLILVEQFDPDPVRRQFDQTDCSHPESGGDARARRPQLVPRLASTQVHGEGLVRPRVDGGEIRRRPRGARWREYSVREPCVMGDLSPDGADLQAPVGPIEGVAAQPTLACPAGPRHAAPPPAALWWSIVVHKVGGGAGDELIGRPR